MMTIPVILSTGSLYNFDVDTVMALAALLAELAQDQFDGLISLELGPYSLQAHDEIKLKHNLQESLSFCRQAV